MRIGVQLTGHAAPEDWHFIDSSEWSSFAPGRSIYAVLGPGTPMAGYDKYAIEDLADGSCLFTIWNDEPNDLAPPGATPVPMRVDDYYARVFVFHGVQPDARIGGAYNNMAQHIVYAGRNAMARLNRGQADIDFRPWHEFVKPAAGVTRAGEWVTDAQSEQHEFKQSRHSSEFHQSPQTTIATAIESWHDSQTRT